ncbi:MAG: glycosyltransferase family 4 protein [Thermoleophilia bacterium]|nr:glycosyltransferase family 4 protein [Thermoleophilia bacterium]
MKILYLSADLGIPILGGKGSSVHMRSLATALARRGGDVAIATPTLVRSPWERPVAFDVPVTHLPPSACVEEAARGIKTFREAVGIDTAIGGELRRILYNEELRVTLKRVLERHPPAVLLERASLFGTAGSLAAEELGVPHLVELNAPLAVEQGAYRRGTLGDLAAEAEKLTLSRADAVLAVSKALAEHVLAAGAPPERVHVLPNGVDRSLFHPGPRDATLRRRLGLAAGPLVGFVGGLRPWHGIEAIPELVALIGDRHPTVQLVVAGDGPLASWLQDEIAARGLGERTRLLGMIPHEDVAALLRELDVAIAPYAHRAHDFYFSPLKLFEYMACGAAVVASRIGQIEEVVRDGETGLLVPPGDAAALTRACERLLDDGELRHRVGAAAAEHVARRYTWDANAARIEALAEGLRDERAAA